MGQIIIYAIKIKLTSIKSVIPLRWWIMGCSVPDPATDLIQMKSRWTGYAINSNTSFISWKKKKRKLDHLNQTTIFDHLHRCHSLIGGCLLTPKFRWCGTVIVSLDGCNLIYHGFLVICQISESFKLKHPVKVWFEACDPSFRISALAPNL